MGPLHVEAAAKITHQSGLFADFFVPNLMVLLPTLATANRAESPADHRAQVNSVMTAGKRIIGIIEGETSRISSFPPWSSFMRREGSPSTSW